MPPIRFQNRQNLKTLLKDSSVKAGDQDKIKIEEEHFINKDLPPRRRGRSNAIPFRKEVEIDNSSSQPAELLPSTSTQVAKVRHHRGFAVKEEKGTWE